MVDRVMSRVVEVGAHRDQTPPGRGSSRASSEAGNSNRVLGLLCAGPKGVK